MAEWFYQRAPDEQAILLVILSVASVTAIYSWWHYLHRLRLIEDTPTSRIRSAAQGYVELMGIARWIDGPSIISPLTTRPCVWYSFRVEQRTHGSKNQHWRTVDSGVSEELFALDDGSASCLVDPDDAEVITDNRTVWYGNSQRPKQSHVGFKNSVLEGVTSTLLSMGGRYRYTEKWIDPGESIYVVGDFRTANDSVEVDVEQAIRSEITRTKKNPEAMASFDRNQDGEVDQQEWEQARNIIRKKVTQEVLSKQANPAIDVIEVPKQKRRYPFIISNRSQHQLAKKFYRNVTGLGIIAVLSTGTLLYWFSLWLAL